MRTRGGWGRWVAAGVVVAAVAAGGVAADPPPNVVLILADDLGGRDLGCYGSKYHKTPHLDALAAAGVRFTDGYAACPVCSPTRAAILTGQYPQRFGITDWLPGRPDGPGQKLLRPKLPEGLPSDAVTLAEALKAAGYTTGTIGKWHLGSGEFGPEKHGFDVNIGGDATGTPRSYFAPFANKTGKMPGLDTAPDGEYLTDRLGEEAAKFVAANTAKPFFLYLPHYAVHTPLKAKPDLEAKYKKGNPGSQGNPAYAAMLESLDAAVGRVLKELDDQNIAGRTLVIFTSDNGGLATLEGMPAAPTFNGPFREGKGYLYEGGVRVPLVVRGPGVAKPGVTSDTVVSSIDLFPTVLDVCGVKSTAKPDGVSFAPVLAGKPPTARDAVYWHYPHYANQGGRPGGAVRSGDFKLIEFYETGRRELFNVKTDLSESRNLALEKPDVVKDLAAKLEAWRKDIGAKMPTPNPDYTPNPQAEDGSITMHARTAEVRGVMLRFEPLPHKNTLGFWVRKEDTAHFEFTLKTPGTFAVEVLQGCGAKSGGADVELDIGGQKVTFTVEDTGGFQNFKAREVGTVTLEKAGRLAVSVTPKSKPGVAVMDLRQIVLKPAKK